MAEKTICNPLRSLLTVEKKVDLSLDWVKEYSKFKLGDSGAMDYWKNLIISLIKKDIGEDIASSPGDWVVIIKKLWRVPSASCILSGKVAEIFGIKTVTIESALLDSELAGGDYAKLSTKEQRMSNLHNKIFLPKDTSLLGKKIIFIDDSYVSGTILEEVKREVVLSNASAFYPYVLADISKLNDFLQEDAINRAALQVDGGFDLLIKILNEEQSQITTKLIYYVSDLNEDKLLMLCERLTNYARTRLASYAKLKNKNKITNVLSKLILK